MSQYPGAASGYPPHGGGRPGGFPPGGPGGYPPPGAASGYPGGPGGYPPPGPYPGAGGYPGSGGFPGAASGYPGPGGYPGQGGYGGYPPPGAGSFSPQHFYNQINPQEMQQLQSFFSAMDKDKSGQVSAQELSNLSFGGERFSLETARMLVKVFDKDRSGEISFQEYAALHKFIMTMEQAYMAFDKDRSRSLDLNEVRMALQQGGFLLGPETVQILYTRFVKNQRGLSLEGFIQLCSYLGMLRSAFSQFDRMGTGWIQVNLDQFVLLNATVSS